MSEQGWQGSFLAAEGVADWVVLHGGAMHVDVSVAREQAEQRLAAALAAGGRIVDDSGAPTAWILADGADNRVCIAAWPDGASRPDQNS
jgi:Glyoxalase-like domain